LKKISKWEKKRVIGLTVVFSLLMNIGHAFQYRINWGWSDAGLASYDYPVIVIFNFSFHIYAIVYFIINFVLFLIMNTWIEFSLLRNLRSEIAEKREKLEKEIVESQSKNSANSEVINKVNRGKQKKIEHDSKKETRAIVMVITNSGLNFVLRFPEIFVFVSSNISFYNIFVMPSYINSRDIYFDNIASILVNLSFLFYMLTFTTNIVVYCVFNPHFKKNYILWESNVKLNE
jgi:hypothetical protein